MRTLFATVLLAVSLKAYAQAPVSTTELENSLRALRVICVSGQQTSLDIELKLKAELKRLGISAKPVLSAKEFEGAVGYVDEQIRSIQDSDIRRCMAQNFTTMIATIKGVQVPPPSPPGTGRVALPIPPAPDDICRYNLIGFNMKCNVTFSGLPVDGRGPPFYSAGSIERCAAYCRGRSDCIAFTMADAPKSSCYLYQSVEKERYQTPMISVFK